LAKVVFGAMAASLVLIKTKLIELSPYGSRQTVWKIALQSFRGMDLFPVVNKGFFLFLPITTPKSTPILFYMDVMMLKILNA
jgi:hypothetical protein